MPDERKRSEILDALEVMEHERRLPREQIIEAIEYALQKAYEKHYGPNQNVTVEVNRDTAEMRIWQRKTVVFPDDVDNPDTEISIDEARQLTDDIEVGMEIDIEVLDKSFGRIAVQSARQVIVQRMRDFERDVVRKEFADRNGTIITGTVTRSDHRDLIVDLGRTEGIIPRSEQANGERFRVGDRIKAVVKEVRELHEGQHGPQVVLSRCSPALLKCLFESQVPEIEKGTVQIKAVVREAGTRSKIAVRSLDPNVDPVGACVGPKGSRVQSIVEELHNEKIDVIPWSEDNSVFIANALQPSHVTKVTLKPSAGESNNAVVIVPDGQLPLAIGREGQNARLAAKLTGWHIDIKSESAAAAEAAAAETAAQADEEQPSEEEQP